MARYDRTDGESVIVHAALPVALAPTRRDDFTVIDLPRPPAAATIIHRGPMTDVLQTTHVLARWIEDNGYSAVGRHREVYLDYDPRRAAEGVTELQLTVTPSR